MPKVWDDHFGKVIGKFPLLIGEWGGRYTGRDKLITDEWTKYMKERGLGCMQFYWCLNPNSVDTGGILQDDWKTAVDVKMNLLADVCPTPTQFSITI